MRVESEYDLRTLLQENYTGILKRESIIAWINGLTDVEITGLSDDEIAIIVRSWLSEWLKESHLEKE